jgi:hypothetical protein
VLLLTDELLAGVLLRADELLSAIELAMLLLNEELNAVLLLDELTELATLPAAVPDTRHSNIPVDCVVLSMETRTRLVTTLLSARVLNAFFASGTLPALTQALPFQYSR